LPGAVPPPVPVPLVDAAPGICGMMAYLTAKATGTRSTSSNNQTMGFIYPPPSLFHKKYINVTINSNIGTNAASLIDLQTLTCTLKQHIERVLADAELALVAFPHKAILKALKEHPEGVSPKYFKKQKSEGVDLSEPKAVGVAMKRSNVIVYRIEDGLYHLMSTAHKTALRSYDPIVKESV
jgi:hypothetical protein